jgi:hypothetical protein
MMTACWVLLRRTQVDELRALAEGANARLNQRLRKRLEDRQWIEPTRTTSWLLASGAFIAVKSREEDVSTLLDQGTYVHEAASSLADSAAAAWAKHDNHRADTHPAGSSRPPH